MIVLAAGFATVAAVGIVAIAWPLWRGRSSDDRAAGLAVLRDQLTEIDHDHARGLIATHEAQAARREVERRLLRAAAVVSQPLRASGLGRGVLVTSAVLAPLAAGALYLALGAPLQADQPLASRALRDDPRRNPEIAAMVAGLEQRLRANPGDGEGWLMLARSRTVLGDPAAAIEAGRHALALLPEDPRAVGDLLEALVAQARDLVTPEAQGLAGRLASLAPEDPRGGYYLAMAAAQAGRSQEALAGFARVLANAPPQAPWRAAIEQVLRRTAADAGVDPAPYLTAARPPDGAPRGSDEAARIAALPPAERQAAIRQMVDTLQARLEARPDDAHGWLRLARAREAMGEQDAARRAFAKAAAAAPEDAEIKLGYAVALTDPAAPGQDLPQVGDEAARLFDQLSAQLPQSPVPWWYLGIRALQQGRPAEARERWSRALALIPGDHPDHAMVRSRLDQLGS